MEGQALGLPSEEEEVMIREFGNSLQRKRIDKNTELTQSFALITIVSSSDTIITDKYTRVIKKNNIR